MLSKSLAVLASAALAAASPMARAQLGKGGPGCGAGRPAPTLPVNGGGKSPYRSVRRVTSQFLRH